MHGQVEHGGSAIGRGAGPAKITPPTLVDVLPRERLFAALDEHLRRPLLWVCGAPGAGKTTLVGSYLEARRLNPLWYRLDPRDADPRVFFQYLARAAGGHSPGTSPPLPASDDPAVARHFFEALFEGLPPGIVLVFDDFDRLPTEAPLGRILAEGLAELPPDRRAVIIGRCAPPSAFAALRAADSVSVLDDAALRLDDAEVAGLADRRAGPGAAGSLRALDAARGWAAGVHLLQSGSDGAVLDDYFTQEVLDHLEEPLQRFVLHTAVLPRLDPDGARLLGGRRAAEHIAALRERRVFLGPETDTPGAVPAYHPLFRAFLKRQAHRRLGGHRYRQLLRTAARWLEETGAATEALTLRREAGDWPGVVRAITSHGAALIDQGRGPLLARWLEEIPAYLLQQAPQLWYWRGVACIPESWADSERAFATSFSACLTRDNTGGMLAATAGALHAAMYWDVDRAMLAPWLDRLERAAPGDGQDTPDGLSDDALCRLFAALVYLVPDHPLVRRLRPRVRELLEHEPTRVQALIGGGALIMERCLAGEPVQAAEVEARMLRLEALQADDAAGGWLRLPWLEARVWRALVAGEPAAAHALLQAAEATAPDPGARAWDGRLAWLHFFLAFTRSDATRAESLLAARARWERCDADRARHHMAQTWLLCDQCQPGRALPHAHLAVELAARTGCRLLQPLATLALARAVGADGHPESAAAHLQGARRKSGGLMLLELCIDLQEAALARQTQGAYDAVVHLSNILPRAQSRGLRGGPAWEPGTMTDLLALALEWGVEKAYAADLIARWGWTPREAPVTVEDWPWPVRIYTMGRFTILRHGTPLTFQGKVQRRPLELLKALIALGGRDVSVAALTDALWPNAEGDAAERAFTVALHRLRRLLDCPGALQLQDNHLTLDARVCWTDVWAFERGLARLERLPAEAPPEQLLRAHRQSLDLYRGPFLGRDGAPSWALRLRERLRSRYLNHVIGFGRRLEQMQRWEQAIEWYHRGLAVDDLAEIFYQRLMICYQRLGRKAEALAIYRRCHDLLSVIMGIEPSHETRRLHRTLLD